jgi:hypothetical protein
MRWHDVSEAQIRWAIFVGLAFTVPLPFYGLVIGGIASLLIVVEIFVAFLLGTIVSFSYPVLPLVLAVHVAIYAAVLIALAKRAALVLVKLAPTVRLGVVLAAGCGLVLLGFLPIYAWGPDNLFWGNLYQTYASVARGLW